MQIFPQIFKRDQAKNLFRLQINSTRPGNNNLHHQSSENPLFGIKMQKRGKQPLDFNHKTIKTAGNLNSRGAVCRNCIFLSVLNPDKTAPDILFTTYFDIEGQIINAGHKLVE